MRSVLLGLACLLGALAPRATAAASSLSIAPAPAGPVTRVEIASPHHLPAWLVDQALEGLAGSAFSRFAVRESLDRLWALGVFARAEVEAIPEAGGVRLRYQLERSPFLERLAWEGDLGLPAVDLAGAASLLLGGPADMERLERAQADVRALYGQEGYLGAAVAIRTREDERTGGQDVTFDIEAGEPADIGRIRIEGATAAGGLGLLRALGLREGQRYREPLLRDGLRAVEVRLRDLGFFEARVDRPEPGWDRASNRVTLDIRVHEGPRTRIEMTGNAALPAAELRPRLTFADAGVVDEIEVRASARQIEGAYREIGYPFAAVTGTLEADGPDRLVRFEIAEGSRVTVETIEFSGNASFPSGRLRRMMQTRPPGLLHRGLFVADTLESDVRVLLRFYRSEGYPEAVVGPAAVTYRADRTGVRIDIPVVEGPRRRVGIIAVTGERVIGAAEILAAMPMMPGDPWDAARVDEGRRLVERLYARRGYHGAQVTVGATLRDGEMDVTCAIVEGEPTRIARVLVGGLTVTREKVVRRELPFAPGQLWNSDDLVEGRRRLGATRLFERVDVNPLRPAPGPYRDVEIAVREAKPWRLDFGIGYETEDGARGFIEIAHDNLFGTGRSLALRERASQRGDLTELTYREPWLLDTAWQGQLTAFRQWQKEVGYQFHSVGGVGTIERFFLDRPGDFLRTAVGYSFREVRRFDVEPGLAAAGITSGTERLASVLLAASWDRRDPQADPRRGSFHLASVETAGGFLASQSDFVKTQLQTSWFVPWPPPTLLGVSARLGLAWPYGRSDRLPIESRFFAGGTTTVRGYTLNAIGPLDSQGNPLGGNGQLVLNLEWRFPIWRWFGGAAFVDAGAIAPEVTDLARAPIFPGAGAGLRIATPIGPVRLDVGYALRPIPGENRLQFYLTIGQAF